MDMDPNDLREELLAVLAAHRELDGSADEELVAGLLEKVGHQSPRGTHYPDLRAAYDALVPLKLSTVAAIAVAQGAILLALGEYMISNVLDLYYPDGSLDAWMVFALVWAVDVIATVAVLSVFTPREASDHSRRVRKRSSSRPGSSS